MDQIPSEDAERNAEQGRSFSPVFVGAVRDRVVGEGTISVRDVEVILAAAGDELALRAALGYQGGEGAELAPALALLRERGFSQTAGTFHDVVVELKRALAEARAALVAAEARASGDLAPLESDAFLQWWHTAGTELLSDLSVHDAALIFHAGADLVLQRRSCRLDQWMVRAAMRIALPYLDKAVAPATSVEGVAQRDPFERVDFAAKTFRRALGDTGAGPQDTETVVATEVHARPAVVSDLRQHKQPRKRRFALHLFPW
jgi:hypothetical protein